MASIVICMELRRLFSDLRKRIKRHSNYLKVIEKMEKRFPWANKDELEENDKCAICWENLDKARRLPCSHMFHHNCLRSWLEQDTSCPTCRKTLQDEKQNVQTAQQQEQPNQQQQQQQIQQGPEPQQQRNFLFRQMRTNLFRFNGSRYFSWLPNLSVEVTHNLGNGFLRINISENQLNLMAQQVHQVFPHVPLQAIQTNIRETHSAELTIENILSGRLVLDETRTGLNQNQGLFENESDFSETESSGSTSDSENIATYSPINQTTETNESNSTVATGSLYLIRKRELIEAARRRFLNRINNETNIDSNTALDPNTNTVRQRQFTNDGTNM